MITEYAQKGQDTNQADKEGVNETHLVVLKCDRSLGGRPVPEKQAAGNLHFLPPYLPQLLARNSHT